ncbi:MAG: DUF115 domain-containing protein [Leptospirales bacterium]|nr:DUF115 domain-containing protein [Leptospirales bacterium]
MGSYQLKETKTGKHTLVFSDGREIRLHSAFDPLTEAQREAAAFEKGRSSHILISGLGLGYHAGAIKEKYPEAHIIILERSKDVTKLAGKYYPDNIRGAGIINSKAELIAFFEEFDINTFRGIAYYIHRPSHRIEPSFYDELTETLKEQISSRISDILTRFEFEERWVTNIFSNLHHLGSALPAEKLFGKFNGYPGIIVSAGPSLRKNISHLEKLKEKAIIVCVDTAYKVCLKSGIIPHIVMTLDAQKHSVKHFLGAKAGALLLADMVSCPTILRSYTGDKALSVTAKYFTDLNGNSIKESTPIIDWIETRTKPIGDIQSGGSVATSAFDLLLNMGCSPIILIGQDLAYTGREIHSAGTHHNDDWLPVCSRVKNLDTINQSVIRKRSINLVEAYGGNGNVITDFVLNLYRSWFQDSAQRVPLEIINATEGGARIKNTVEKKLSLLAGKIPARAKTPAETLDEILKNYKASSCENLIDELQKALTALNELKAIALEIKDENSFMAKFEELAAKNNIRSLVEPFLRKTIFFIDRQNLDAEKAALTLSKEVSSAIEKLIPMTAKARDRLLGLKQKPQP